MFASPGRHDNPRVPILRICLALSAAICCSLMHGFAQQASQATTSASTLARLVVRDKNFDSALEILDQIDSISHADPDKARSIIDSFRSAGAQKDELLPVYRFVGLCAFLRYASVRETPGPLSNAEIQSTVESIKTFGPEWVSYLNSWLGNFYGNQRRWSSCFERLYLAQAQAKRGQSMVSLIESHRKFQLWALKFGSFKESIPAGRFLVSLHPHPYLNTLDMVITCNALGLAYGSLSKFDSSAYYYQFALDLLSREKEDQKVLFWKALLASNTAMRDPKLRASGEIMDIIRQDIRISKQSHESLSLFWGYIAASEWCITDAEDWKTGEAYYDSAKAIRKKSPINAQLMPRDFWSIDKIESKIDRHHNEWEKVTLIQARQITRADSIQSSMNLMVVRDAYSSANLQVIKEDLMMTSSAAAQQEHSLLLLQVFLTASFCVGGLIFFTIVRNNRLKLAKSKLLATEFELSLLKSHLNPHFLFNAINNLYGHAISSPSTLPDKITLLADLLRFQTTALSTNLIRLQEEIDFFRKYISYSESSQYNLTCKMSVHGDTGELLVPPASFFTFLENAIKYSMHSPNPTVVAEWHITTDVIRLVVSNSKSPTQQEISGTKTGIKNLERRILNLGYKYSIEESSRDTEFTVVFSLYIS